MHQPQTVGRLAPSPTGAQHLGNARTFLVAWLATRSVGGRLILRVEDIDTPRIKSWATQQAIDDLRWLGLDWDEGPDCGGTHAPYLQTLRASRYHTALQRLVASGVVYPCTCSRAEIQRAASAPHAGMDGSVYPGTCAAWRAGDRLPPEGTYCWRFRVADRCQHYQDLILGPQRLQPCTQLGDFPLTRKTGDVAYHLAVVVDDAAMGVNQVIRGADLVPSTFRHLQLIDALGCAPPQYAHVPLVLGPDGRRLAKRHGDTRLSQLRADGIQPEAIIGWAAESLGLMPTAEAIKPSELLDVFSLEQIDRQAVVTRAEDWEITPKLVKKSQDPRHF